VPGLAGRGAVIGKGSLGAFRCRGVWLAVLPVAAWAAVRVLGLDGASDLAPLMAFTPYAAIGAFLLVGLCVAVRNWAAATVTAIALVALASATLPRGFGSGEEAPPDAAHLDVLSANLYFGKADPRALVELVEEHRPDALAVQEITPELAAALNRAGLREPLPYAVLALPSRGPGRGIYARRPLRPLPQAGSAADSMPPVALRLDDGRSVRLVDVHPRAPKPGKVGRWADALERLPSTGDSGPPWVLLGDFNATLDQAAMRDLLDRGYRDAAAATGKGLAPTWPTDRLVPPLIAIDHVLADERLGIADFGVEDLPGTDHRAIWATLFFR
jgi:endonuclease/exonuclease/phosphatase (EEP) superfamily protein YafD